MIWCIKHRDTASSPDSNSEIMPPLIEEDSDIVGLSLRVFWANLDIWIPGKVKSFCAETGEHLIEYHCGEQRWTLLSSCTFEINAPSGPTVLLLDPESEVSISNEMN